MTDEKPEQARPAGKKSGKNQNQKAMVVGAAISTMAALKPNNEMGIYIVIGAIALLTIIYVSVQAFLDYNEKDEE